MKTLLLTYYGDDFTGSTDVMEALSLAGVKTVLFLAPPMPGDLARFPGVQAAGLAGVARSLPTAAMASELRPAFRAFAGLPSHFFHYKLCSTFDSSPSTGSIGRALELALGHFPARCIPLVVGAPVLRRYVVFGNLFAHFEGETLRIDRHPAMSRHPVTPMDEADVRRHLARQTELPVALIDWLALRRGASEVARLLCDHAQGDGRRIVLFDTLAGEDLPIIGAALCSLAEKAAPGGIGLPTLLFGSSGVEYALVMHWRASGRLAPAPAIPRAPAVDQLVVMSGSAAPQTAAQLADARGRGWEIIRIAASLLTATDTAGAEHQRLLAAALKSVAAGRSVILASAEGPEDTALAAGREIGARLAAAMGRLLREIILASGVRRVAVTGGDTSGWVARELGILALEFLCPLAPGGPLCRASSSDPAINGLEISLKGGQVGHPDYLERVRNPSLQPPYP